MYLACIKWVNPGCHARLTSPEGFTAPQFNSHRSLHVSCPLLVQGIPLNEQKRLANVAVDAVFDSVSIATTFREELGKAGVIFCSISEAVKEYPDLVRKHMGSVVSSCVGWLVVGASSRIDDTLVLRTTRCRGGACSFPCLQQDRGHTHQRQQVMRKTGVLT